MSNTEQEEEHNKVDVESIESMTHQQQHVHLQSQQHQQLIILFYIFENMLISRKEYKS